MKFKYALAIFGLILIISCTHTQPKMPPSLAIFRETLNLKLKDKRPYFEKLGYTFKWGDSTSLTYKHIDEKDTSSYRISNLKILKACMYTTNNQHELALIVNEARNKGFKPQPSSKHIKSYSNKNEILYVIDSVKLGKRIINLNLVQFDIKNKMPGY